MKKMIGRFEATSFDGSNRMWLQSANDATRKGAY